ncbi:uncharacterized protein [Eucyclogobius newberryi]|uniref:uncharacterized protein n=1 Tax=Eucyclogobius newberryi TaxID=166745 RepID=UPI003B5B9DE7
MMERIAQLDHSKSLLRDQNTEMRIWLDAADEDMALLRAENNHLKKQVKDLVKTVLDAQSVESEATACLPDYPDLKVRNEMKIQILEKESAFLQEENQTLTDEIRNLLQLQETDDVTLSKLKVSLQTLESELEGAQLGLQQRDEVIHQKHQELKHAKELVDEYSTIIKDLRLKNQELKEELEAGQDELTFAGAVDLLEASENRRSPALSFAEELRQLSFSAQANISKSEDTQTNLQPRDERWLQLSARLFWGIFSGWLALRMLLMLMTAR